MDTAHHNIYRPGLRLALTFGVALLVLVSVAYWGGAAKMNALFFAGVAALSGLILGFGALTWWLFASRIPDEEEGPTTARPPLVRQVVGVLAVVSGLLFIAGATWDEAWHTLYGIGAAVNDFLWPPHILLYGSMGLGTLFAMGGMLLLARGEGGLRRRFRDEPLIGMLALASAYLVLSAPSDYLWHVIYGLDITGWSLPHIIITTGAALVMLSTAAILMSQVVRREWRGLGSLRFPEALAIFMIGAALMPVTQAGLTEWDAFGALGLDPQFVNPVFLARPPWLYPVAFVSIALFFGNFALHITRRAGAATLALQLGQPDEIAAEDIAKLHQRYTRVYGQQ